MKVIVASIQTQGAVEGDYAWTLEGELVHLPPLECASPDTCGCSRGFAGVASHRATSTAEVAERDLDEIQVFEAVAQSLADGGWFDDARSEDAVTTARELVEPLLEVARRLPLGTVLRRSANVVFAGTADRP